MEKSFKLKSLILIVFFFLVIALYPNAEAKAVIINPAEIDFLRVTQDATVFNADEGCVFKIRVHRDVFKAELYLDDFHGGSGFVLIASTDENETEENVDIVNLILDNAGTPDNANDDFKYFEYTFMRNGDYKVVVYYDNEGDTITAEKITPFADIDFYAPFVGTIKGDDYIAYDDFYYEGNDIIFYYSVRDNVTPQASARSGIQRINFLKDGVLVQSVNHFNSQHIVQTYSGSFRVSDIGLYQIQTIDWVGNAQTYLFYELTELNTDFQIYLASIQARVDAWFEGGRNESILENLQFAFNYYKIVHSDANSTEKEKIDALNALYSANQAYDNAELTIEINIENAELLPGELEVMLTGENYTNALRGDKIQLDIIIEKHSKSNFDDSGVAALSDMNFNEAITLDFKFYFNGEPASPTMPIKARFFFDNKFDIFEVISYNAGVTKSDYANLEFEQGSTWISFDIPSRHHKGVVILQGSSNAFSWTYLIIGLCAFVLIGFIVFLIIKYKKEFSSNKEKDNAEFKAEKEEDNLNPKADKEKDKKE